LVKDTNRLSPSKRPYAPAATVHTAAVIFKEADVLVFTMTSAVTESTRSVPSQLYR